MAFSSVLFISSLGMVLYVNGSAIRDSNREDSTIPGWFVLEFVGAFLALFCWVKLLFNTNKGMKSSGLTIK